MVQIEANAKINLTLDILGVRPDGYHEVEMVMQSVGLFDTIRVVRRQSGIDLQMDAPSLPTDETNLAWKAARLFLDVYKIQAGVAIEIEKRIPIAAGLAGGSTDAAGVLMGMNRLFEKGLSAQELCALGEKLGSDVPFCIEGGTMLATGRGEILRRLPDLPQLFVVLAKPPISVSTAWAYKTYDQVGVARHPDTKAMLAALDEGNVEKIAGGLANVLEEVTMKAHAVVGDYKRALSENGALASLMSGSGPTVFALAQTRPDAERAAAAISARYPEAKVFVVSTAGQNII
ncbi:MAG: 4-(cytidine 5'-diphospho)-2-C-methyl-D-erythritol kinase [Schwartzia sp.]|nr:4-(cytidine 5'-diphospho)-2-C-methyl-D-erythritol kinase [Schwartzia sp. (in: firmicutes)]